MGRKYIYWILLMLVLSYSSYAAIEIQQNFDRQYNLGDKISLQIAVSHERYFEGLLKVSLFCGEKQLPFFITPLTLYQGQKLEEKVPELTASKHILGECRIVIDMADADGTITEQKTIEDIQITSKLNLSLDALWEYLPGQDVVFSGTVKDMDGNTVKNATLSLNFNDGDYDILIKGGSFRHPIKIPETIKSGMHFISILVEDIYGNKADILASLNVIPKPTSLEVTISKFSFFPGETVDILVNLVDQNKEPINDTLKLSIKNSKGIEIFSQNVQSNSKLGYPLEQFAVPGNYLITSQKNDLTEHKSFNVSKIERLAVTSDGSRILIKNEGNTPYDDKANLDVEANGQRYLLIKKLKLIPGEVIEVDLSQELPAGMYNVAVDTPSGFKVGYSDAAGNSTEKISDVPVDDRRSFFKRVFHGLGGLTGGVIGINEGIAAPFYILILLLAVILAVIYIHKKHFMEHRFLEDANVQPKKNEVSKMLNDIFSKKK